MRTKRIYAAASGQCLDRNTADVDESERSRMEADFHSGVRFAIDAANDEVRGFVPAARTSHEAFFAVVGLDPPTDSPVRLFYRTVRDIFNEYEGWAIRYGAPEGPPFRSVAAEDTGVEAGPGQIDGRREVLSSIRNRQERDHLTFRTPGVPSAIDVIGALSDSGLDVPIDVGTIIITRDHPVAHINADISFVVVDTAKRMDLFDPEAGSGGADSATESDSSSGSGVVSRLKDLLGDG